jgi:hypothetical protein
VADAVKKPKDDLKRVLQTNEPGVWPSAAVAGPPLATCGGHRPVADTRDGVADRLRSRADQSASQSSVRTVIGREAHAFDTRKWFGTAALGLLLKRSHRHRSFPRIQDPGLDHQRHPLEETFAGADGRFDAVHKALPKLIDRVVSPHILASLVGEREAR